MRTVDAKVRIEGEELAGFDTIYIFQSLIAHDTFEVAYPIADASQREIKKFDDSIFKKFDTLLGKSISISYKAKENSTEETRYKGVITQVELIHHGPRHHILFRGHSPIILLDQVVVNRTFCENSLEEIAQQIIGAYSLPAKYAVRHKNKLPFVVQFQESDYKFLKRLSEYYGEWFYYDGQEVHVGSLKNGEPIDLSWPEHIEKYSVQLNTIPLKERAQAYDYLKKDLYDYQTQPDRIGPQGLRRSALEGSSKTLTSEQLTAEFEEQPDQASLEKQVQYRLQERGAQLLKSLIIADDPRLTVGSAIRTRNTGCDGVYKVLEIKSTFNQSGLFQGEIVAIPSDIQNPPATFQPVHKTHVQSAVVVDNADPEKLGRVQVRFHWQGGGQTPWIRYVQPYAGTERGSFIIPEIGDEVIVSFEAGNPSRPIVLGSLYNKVEQPDAELTDSKENEIKGITTRQGNKLILIDRDGKEEIKILNPDNKNFIRLTLDSKPLIEVQSEDTIKLTAPKIELQADQEIKIHAGQKLDISAGSEFKQTSSSQMSIESMTLKVQSSGISEYKGALIKIN